MKTRVFFLFIAMCMALAGCGNRGNTDLTVSTSTEIGNADNDEDDSFSDNTEDDPMDMLRDSTVMIYAGEYHGTGVVIGNDGKTITIATVAHLMNGYEQGIVNFYSGKTGFAKVRFIDEASDICLLMMSVDDFYDDFGKKIKAVTVDREQINKLDSGDEILLLGSAVNVSVNAAYGTIADKDYFVPGYSKNLIYIYADAMSGMSGSGCYTKDGRLIGILTAGSDNSEVLCIKINDYLDEWEMLED